MSFAETNGSRITFEVTDMETRDRPNEFPPSEAVNSHEGHRPNSDDRTAENVPVKRGKVDSITIYEVSESELTTLERGAPSSVYLNMLTFFLGIFLSFLATLVTVNFKDKLVILVVFVVITVVSGFTCIILLTLWLRGRHDFKEVITTIKGRIRE
jgi:hypothetical protein